MHACLCAHIRQASQMRINYTRGGLEESEMAQWNDDPMRAWAEWFKLATDLKVRFTGCLQSQWAQY